MRQRPGTANALATKMYEERLKLPLRESLDDTSLKVFLVLNVLFIDVVIFLLIHLLLLIVSTFTAKVW